jgi:hypothetical protein
MKNKVSIAEPHHIDKALAPRRENAVAPALAYKVQSSKLFYILMLRRLWLQQRK